MNRKMQAELPNPGVDRWWRITHNPKSRTNPIVVTLMECLVTGRRAMSAAIGYEWTVADPKRCAEAAEVVLARVSAYKEVVGEYNVG
jgi:hypothetical protein